MSSQGLRAAVVLAFVFALGALTGIFVDRHHLAPASTGLSAEAVHNAAMSELRAALDLDEEQMDQIHGILARHQDEVQQAWETLRPELQTAMQGVHFEIAELLRPDQRTRYHEWLSERQRQAGDGSVISLPRH
jgi:hypothetical protein